MRHQYLSELLEVHQKWALKLRSDDFAPVEPLPPALPQSPPTVAAHVEPTSMAPEFNQQKGPGRPKIKNKEAFPSAQECNQIRDKNNVTPSALPSGNSIILQGSQHNASPLNIKKRKQEVTTGQRPNVLLYALNKDQVVTHPQYKQLHPDQRQLTSSWFLARRGHITASRLGIIRLPGAQHSQISRAIWRLGQT